MGVHVPQTSMSRHPWRALAGLLLPFRARLFFGILISILQCATALPMVWLIRRIFDRTEGTAPSLSLQVVGLYLVTLAITTAALGILGQLLIQQAVKSAVVLVIGSRAVEQGSITSGDLLSFYALAALTLNYVRDAGLGVGSVVLGRDPWLALHTFLAQSPQHIYPGSRQIPFTGAISLRNLSFQYSTPGRERRIFNDLSIDLIPGRFIALTGANGSGKSTLLQLVLGLYRPDSGSLLADGIPYTELDVADLRRQIGVVAQDPPLITGTIRENIAYAHPDAPLHEVQEAARTALAHAFIQQLPKGYETEVGEHGVLLSGGQRQRLALARDLLIHAPLLILDEPTNHVDQEGVRDLLLSLRSLHPSPAILVITHVPAVLALADEAWTLADGQLTRNPLPAQ